MVLINLDPELEAQLPEAVRTVRAFYRSLSLEDRAKLDSAIEGKTERSESQSKEKGSKFCFECGKQINRIAKFCEYCGIQQPSLSE